MDRIRSLPTVTKLFLLALVLRLVPVLFSINLPIGLDDMFQYDMLARSIAAGEGFRWYGQEDLDLVRSYIDMEFVVGDYDPRGVLTSFRAPGYPAFLALIYRVSGLQWRLFAARLAQAFLGAAVAPMAYALGRRLFPKQERAARWAGYAVAAYPMFVIFPLALATETLFIPLVYGGMLLLLRARESGRDGEFLAAGLVLSYATLTRSVIFGFVGLAAIWLWLNLSKEGFKLFHWSTLRKPVPFLLGAMILMVPWVARNSLLYDEFVFVENSLGYNLHMGYHPEGTGSFQYGISLELFPYLDDGLRNEIGVEAGLKFIQEDPGRVPYLIVRKLGHFFALEKRAISYFYSNGFFGQIPTAPLVALFLIFTLPFVVVSSLGAATLALMRPTKGRWLLLLLLGGYLLPHVLLLAEPRFHLALVPALAVLAGYGWVERRALWQRARAQRGRLLLALVLVGLLWLNWGMELWRDADKLQVLFGPNGYRAGFPY